uniref:Uncharacterized protein n=1 Tax=Leersia perrieri TaxID=77586 RepID=A0A0D9XJ61_9ORYZ
MWATYHLAKLPSVLAELREENTALAREKNGVGFITLDDIRKMKYSAKVRYTIPKRWRVIVWLRSLHVDPKYYDDPLSFNPDRWDSQISPPPSLTPRRGEKTNLSSATSSAPMPSRSGVGKLRHAGSGIGDLLCTDAEWIWRRRAPPIRSGDGCGAAGEAAPDLSGSNRRRRRRRQSGKARHVPGVWSLREDLCRQHAGKAAAHHLSPSSLLYVLKLAKPISSHYILSILTLCFYLAEFISSRWELLNPDAGVAYLPHPRPIDGAAMSFREL